MCVQRHRGHAFKRWQRCPEANVLWTLRIENLMFVVGSVRSQLCGWKYTRRCGIGFLHFPNDLLLPGDAIVFLVNDVVQE